eukprot:7066153-Lingulodinium_polyedra.AAC.1
MAYLKALSKALLGEERWAGKVKWNHIGNPADRERGTRECPSLGEKSGGLQRITRTWGRSDIPAL